MTTQDKNTIEILETRLITMDKKSAFWGLITWYERVCTTHIANDLIVFKKTPIRKIIIVEEDALGFNSGQREINLDLTHV